MIQDPAMDGSASEAVRDSASHSAAASSAAAGSAAAPSTAASTAPSTAPSEPAASAAASVVPPSEPVPSDAVAPARIERPVPVMREWLIVIAPLIALAVGLLKMLVATDSGQFWAGVVTAAIGLVLVAVGVLVACRRIRSLRGVRR